MREGYTIKVKETTLSDESLTYEVRIAVPTTDPKNMRLVIMECGTKTIAEQLCKAIDDSAIDIEIL